MSTRNSLHQLIDADGALICETCRLERPYQFFEDCESCLVAVAIARGTWGELELLYNGAPFMEPLRREHARQCAAFREVA